jgi:putative transposase
MLDLISAAIQTTPDIFKSRDVLLLENLALGQQLAVLLRKHPRPRLKNSDRLFWVTLSRLWKHWRNALVIVKPETVVRWHRQGFKRYWRWKSRRRSPGRPKIRTQ